MDTCLVVEGPGRFNTTAMSRRRGYRHRARRARPGVWLWCERCQHHAPLACAVAVIRWCTDVSSDRLRQRARCSSCGRKVRRSSIPAGAAMTWASCRSPLHALGGGLNTRRMLRAPCLPSPAERPPSGDGWLHEIKHDGMRIMARRDSAGVRLITRQGNDFTSAFHLLPQQLQRSR